jgi:hypothetical protein
VIGSTITASFWNSARSHLLTSPAPQRETSGRAYEVTHRIFDHRLVHHMVTPRLMASLPA